MSDRKLIYEVARDIQGGKITTIDDAMATWGHVVDRDELLDVLDSLDCVHHAENVDGEDVTVIRVPESWERTWSEEEPVA